MAIGLLGGLTLLIVLGVTLGRGGGGREMPAASTDARVGASGLSEGERATLLARGLTLVTPQAERGPAPLFDLKTASFADGSTFHLEAERGHVVVLFFMAYWCPTCVSEAQALAEIHRQYQGVGVRVLAVDVDQGSNEQLLAQFRDRAGGGRYLWGIDRDFRVARALDVQMLDSTVVIDRKGRIAYRDGSPTPRETLLAVIETVLAEDLR